MLRESKYCIILPNVPKPKKGEPYPFGTKVYVNSERYREMSFADTKAVTVRVNDYNRGLVGAGDCCRSLDEYQDTYMSMQCVEKIQRDHKERALFSVWDCDCKQYVYKKQCPCSVLARHLDCGDEMDIDNKLQELPQNKRPGRPLSKIAPNLKRSQCNHDDGSHKRSLDAVQGDQN